MACARFIRAKYCGKNSWSRSAFQRTRWPWPCAHPHRASTICVRERRAVSADTALRLARYFGTSAEFWLGLQSDYDMKVALAENGAKIEQDVVPMEQAA